MPEFQRLLILRQTEESLPLQQGLKHNRAQTILEPERNWRITSITTRIETFFNCIDNRCRCYNWRITSITTRIETCYWLNHCREKSRLKNHFHYNKDWNNMHLVRLSDLKATEESLPLQQGLKRLAKYSARILFTDWRITSITTRIETRVCEMAWWKYADWRITSITTRIETEYQQSECNQLEKLKNHFHYNKDWNLVSCFLSCQAVKTEESLPLQQGLKQVKYFMTMNMPAVLKNHFHYNKDWNKFERNKQDKSTLTEESLPLQQGLKLWHFSPFIELDINWRITSITTRIET